MRGIRVLLPTVLTAATIWWACDGRTVTSGGGGTTGDSQVASVQVSLQQGELFYSQSTRTAITDTVSILVLDQDRSAMPNVSVSCEVQSNFGGAVVPLNGHQTDDNGEARYAFRVLGSDANFTGDQTVSFVATAGNRTGTANLLLHEQSNIQLAFLNPADNGVIYRMQDPAETIPVEVYAYRDVTVDGTNTRVGVPGVRVNFSVHALGQGISGALTVQGTTGADGVTDNVYYANSAEQPADTVALEFSASISGTPSISAVSHVNLINDYGYTLTRMLPGNPNLQGDLLCADSTRFVFQYLDRNGQRVSGAAFNITPSMGQFIDDDSYSMVTSETGSLAFAWRSCASEGGDLVLTLTNQQQRAYSYVFPVAAPRPVELAITSPVTGNELEIDSECLPENAVNVRARLRYADNQNPIANRTVRFASNLGQIGSSAITDNSGTALVTWQDCDENDANEDLILTAAFYGGQIQPILLHSTTHPTVLPLGVPANITVAVANNVLPVPDSGALETTVTATVFNSQNQRLGANLAVGFRTNGVGDITASAFTDANGQATATFSMNGQTGVSQVTAFYTRPNTEPPEELPSTPATITINSGVPANVVLSTPTPRIQILGFGSNSAALVTARIVDSQGSNVTMNVPVRFTIENAPDDVTLTIPGQSDTYGQGDTLSVVSQNGRAIVTVNAGRVPGPVQIGCFVDGPNYDVYSNGSLVTILAGPPAYGQIDFDGVGIQIGASVWRVEWSVQLWDQYSNSVEDSTAVWFHLTPEDVCAMEGFGLTGVTADGAEGFPGIAGNWMQYHCSAIGDTLLQIRASTNGVIPEVDPWTGDTTWVAGTLNIDYVEPGGFFQIPFQTGDRDDNLTLSSNVTQIRFDMAPCASHFTAWVPVTARLIDGYACTVRNQTVRFQADFNLPWQMWDAENEVWVDTDTWVTDDQGVIEARLQVTSQIMERGGPCDGAPDGCTGWVPLTVFYGASRLPGGWPQSNQLDVTLLRGCQ